MPPSTSSARLAPRSNRWTRRRTSKHTCSSGCGRSRPTGGCVRTRRRGAQPGILIARWAAVAALVACGILVWQDIGQRRELAALRERAERGPAAIEPAAPRPTAPRPGPAPIPAAPAAPGQPVAPRAEREWALERSRLEAAIAQAETARTRAEAEAARWRSEVTRIERTLASSAPAASGVSPPGVVDPGVVGPDRGVDDRREDVRRLAADVRRLEIEARGAASRARDYQNALQLALNPGSRRVALRAVDRAAGGATASALLAADGRLLVTTRDLPPLGSDKCYQLWIIRRDTPAVVSGGVLNDAPSGQVVHIARVEGRADRVTGFAITDEPAGGSDSSRGRKLLFGALP